jgi:flavin reductase (DIM6/NTAB) family NADH-FMN oxidoreductase RutF
VEHEIIKPSEWLLQPGLARETNLRLTHEGILLASRSSAGKLNPMTIGWGVFGAIWGRAMFLVLVRPSRFTYECLEATGDFTVNVMPADMPDVPDYCGTTSGRSIDKMAEKHLTERPSDHITSGGVAEANIIFECRVVHKHDVQQPAFTGDIISHYYPEGDFHRVYYGEILSVAVRQAFLASLS